MRHTLTDYSHFTVLRLTKVPVLSGNIQQILSGYRIPAHPHSAVARALIGGGGGGGDIHAYIHVVPDEFILKSVVFKFISKEHGIEGRAEHEYMNITPPPPPPQLTL